MISPIQDKNDTRVLEYAESSRHDDGKVTIGWIIVIALIGFGYLTC